MKKPLFFSLLIVVSIAFSCQKKPYASFQINHAETPTTSSLAVGQAPVAPLVPMAPAALTASNSPSLPLVSTNTIASVYTGSQPKQLSNKTTVLRQYKNLLRLKKSFKQLADKQPKPQKDITHYKGLAGAAAFFGLATLAAVAFSIFIVSNVGLGLILSGILGLLAFILGVSSVGKLTGSQKTPAVIGIIGGIVGLVVGIYVVILIIAWTSGGGS